MSTLHDRINSYLNDQVADDRVVDVAEPYSTEYEYLLARAEVNVQNAQKHQEKPKRGLSER